MVLETARERSIALRSVRRGLASVRTAVGGSRLGRALRRGRAPGDDGADEPVVGPPTGADAAIRGSAVGSAAVAVRSRLAAAGSGARVAGIGATLRRYATASFAYRWLTADPEPEVIVIDLRRTNSVGPFVALLDRATAALGATAPASSLVGLAESARSCVRARPLRAAGIVTLPCVVGSLLVVGATATPTAPLVAAHVAVAALAALGLRSRRSLDDLAETRAVRLAIAAFEPPEPPEPSGSRPRGESERGGDRGRPRGTDDGSDDGSDDGRPGDRP